MSKGTLNKSSSSSSSKKASGSTYSKTKNFGTSTTQEIITEFSNNLTFITNAVNKLLTQFNSTHLSKKETHTTIKNILTLCSEAYSNPSTAQALVDWESGKLSDAKLLLMTMQTRS